MLQQGMILLEVNLDVRWMVGNIVVAIEFQFAKGGGDTEPAWHGGRLDARNASFADDEHISAAHGTADENHFELDLRFKSELSRAKEKDAARADVARDQGNGEVLGSAIDAAQAQREAEGSPGIFALLGNHADGVGGHARKAAHGTRWFEGHDAK